jgi:hypothetical protein
MPVAASAFATVSPSPRLGNLNSGHSPSVACSEIGLPVNGHSNVPRSRRAGAAVADRGVGEEWVAHEQQGVSWMEPLMP